MSSAIVEQLGEFCHRALCGARLFSREFTDDCEEGGIDSPRIEEERSEHFKDAELVGGVERSGGIGQRSEMGFGAVLGTLPRIGRVFRFCWRSVLKAPQGSGNVPWHGNVTRAVGIVPGEG